MSRRRSTGRGATHPTLRLGFAYAVTTVLVAAPLAWVSAASAVEPTPAPSATATVDPSAIPTPDPAATPTSTAGPTVTDPAAAAGTSATTGSTTTAGVPSATFARVTGDTTTATYLASGADLTDARPWERLRLRFDVPNTGPTAQTLSATLEADVAGGGYAPVDVAEDAGSALHLATEWVPEGEGTVAGPDLTTLTATAPDSVDGVRSARNPAPDVVLPAGAHTIIEFTLEVAGSAPPASAITLRLTSGGSPIADLPTAVLRTAALDEGLTPGQQTGSAVTTPAGRTAYPLLASPMARSVGGTARTALFSTLAAPSLLAITPGTVPVTGTGGGHGTGMPSSTECATCHVSHRGQSPTMLPRATMAQTCLACHDGTGASSNVAQDYAAGQPANNPGTASIYSHDATSGTGTHALTGSDEMAGVANRHALCADCHNAHRAKSATPSTQQTANGVSIGWSVPGALEGNPGLSVTNGAAGTTPTYAFLDGIQNAPTLEYQVCLTCHSNRTTLPTGVPGKPSTMSFDKGAEFNPANASYHPVEAPGKNQTTAMAASLAGTSPYKLWNFTTADTVRCVNCHANNSATSTDPGSTLSPHASTNRGILIRTYKDRTLKGAQETYAAADHALCLVCHAEAPFTGTSSTATNFRFHSKHVRGLAGKGNRVGDIDTPGAGMGNSTCAECHFRLHSTTNAIPGQNLNGSRLVNFSPNVVPVTAGGTVTWTKGATTGGSCTLTCHGKIHNNLRY